MRETCMSGLTRERERAAHASRPSLLYWRQSSRLAPEQVFFFLVSVIVYHFTPRESSSARARSNPPYQRGHGGCCPSPLDGAVHGW